MGNGALPHGPSYRAHPRLYLNSGPLRLSVQPVSEVLRTYEVDVEPARTTQLSDERADHFDFGVMHQGRM